MRQNAGLRYTGTVFRRQTCPMEALAKEASRGNWSHGHRDRIEFRLFNSSFVFNITSRQELSFHRSKPSMAPCSVFMVLAEQKAMNDLL